jgi:hypothetical protein
MGFEATMPTKLTHWLPALGDIETEEEIERNNTKRERDELEKELAPTGVGEHSDPRPRHWPFSFRK